MKVKEIVFENGHVFPVYILENDTKLIPYCNRGIVYYITESIYDKIMENFNLKQEEIKKWPWYKRLLNHIVNVSYYTIP